MLQITLRGQSVMSSASILVAAASNVERDALTDLLLQGGLPSRGCRLDEALQVVAAESPTVVLFAINDEPEALDVCRRCGAERANLFLVQLRSTPSDLPPDSCFDAVVSSPLERPQELLVLARTLLRFQAKRAAFREYEERAALVQDAAEIAVLDWEISSSRFVHSDHFAALFDLPPRRVQAALSADQILSRIHPKDRETLLVDFANDSRTARHFDTEFRIVRSEGGIRWISARGRFFTSSEGEPQRMLALCFDVTNRKDDARANAELAAIVASANDAIVSIDEDGEIRSWNACAERLFGLARQDALGRPIGEVLPAMSLNGVLRAELLDEQVHHFELRHGDGVDKPALDLSVTSAQLPSLDGRALGMSLIIRDISAHRQREDHVRFLMRELTHRSKNLLAVIQAMARQSLAKDITPDEFVRRFTERLAGLAGSHDLLSAVDWKGASLGDLARSQLRHFEDLFGTRIVFSEDVIFVRPEAAQNIGIALHELSTNAAKYGALSNEMGTVRILWSVGAAHGPKAPMLNICWKEEDGPPVTMPTRRGFGHIVMERIAGRALGGTSTLDFRPDGVVWTLDVPASSALAD